LRPKQKKEDCSGNPSQSRGHAIGCGCVRIGSFFPPRAHLEAFDDEIHAAQPADYLKHSVSPCCAATELLVVALNMGCKLSPCFAEAFPTATINIEPIDTSNDGDVAVVAARLTYDDGPTIGACGRLDDPQPLIIGSMRWCRCGDCHDHRGHHDQHLRRNVLARHAR
jgi:hypothetical protein